MDRTISITPAHPHPCHLVKKPDNLKRQNNLYPLEKSIETQDELVEIFES
jgi:hypothetical protein